MKAFILFDASGEIRSNGTCQDEDINFQAMAGLTLMECLAAPSTHFVQTGVLTEYTPVQQTAKAARPPWSVWSNTTFSWTDLRTLAERKAGKWDALKLQRGTREFSTFTWGGSTFDSDPQSQSRIQGGVLLAMQSTILDPFSVVWTLSDNTTRTLNGADMIAVGKAMATLVMTTHAIGRSLRAQVEAATTIAQLESILWPI